MKYSIDIVSEDALLVRFISSDIDKTAALVSAVATSLRENFSDRLVDIVPAYDSLLVVVDFDQMLPQQIKKDIRNLLEQLDDRTPPERGRIVDIPCYYGPEAGLDLAELAAGLCLSVEDIVQRHAEKEYCVYAVGFSPGFPYLGYLDSTICYPRKATPRSRVSAGSVGIAANQTGIYPQATPGGWNIIGRTPVKIFDPSAQREDALCLLSVGATVRFVSVDKSEFLALGGQLDA